MRLDDLIDSLNLEGDDPDEQPAGMTPTCASGAAESSPCFCKCD